MSKAKGSPSIRTESKRYFATLGAYVAQRRKSLGYTQAELARAIGVSQQAVFAYELGDRRISVIILVKLAKVLRVSVEEMIGLKQQPRALKQRLSPRAMRHAERLQALPRTHQRFVTKIIDVLEERGGTAKGHAR
jgi:transcriptional regulator with XRE-family HTH domain